MFKKLPHLKTRKLATLVSLATASLIFTNTANATIVEFQTSHGDFQVNLFDQTTPATVANFLSYVNDGYYTNSIVHRAETDFVVQAGGYAFEGAWPLTRLSAGSPVVNEAIYSNVAGTITMAKLASDANSATDQWFFNLADNSDTAPNLDLQNEGFTVFGQVVGDGMTIVNQIAQLGVCYYDSNLTSIPMIVEEGKTCADLTAPGLENFVVIEAIVVVDSSAATASELTPLLSKYPDSDGDGVKDINDDFPSDPDRTTEEPVAEESDGGSITWFGLVMLSLLSIRKRFTKL